MKLLCPLKGSPLDSYVNRRTVALEMRVKVLTPACRTLISVLPLVVGLLIVVEQVGFEKIIQPLCQSAPEVAQVGVAPVKAFAVLVDMQIETQEFRLIASVRTRETSLANSVTILLA